MNSIIEAQITLKQEKAKEADRLVREFNARPWHYGVNLFNYRDVYPKVIEVYNPITNTITLKLQTK